MTILRVTKTINFDTFSLQNGVSFRDYLPFETRKSVF